MSFICKHILLLLPVYFLFSGLIPAQAQKKNRTVYIEALVPSNLDATAREEMEYRVESTFALNLKMSFQCIEVLTRSTFRKDLHNEIVEAVNEDREVDQNILKNICNYDDLLKITVVQLGPDKIIISAVMIQRKPLEAIADAQLLARNTDMYQITNKVAQKMVDALSLREYCPYTGTLSLDHTTVLKTSEKQTTPITLYDQVQKQPCIGTEVRIHSVNMQQETRWEIQRLSSGPAYAKLRSEITEIIEEQEETDCYPCSSGRVGGRSHQVTTIKRFFTDHVSEESSGPAAQHNDARIEIRFLEDSTYLVIVKATSVFDKNTTITTRAVATGTCDPMNETETIETANTVFINITLGPFKGTLIDGTLSATGTIDLPSEQEGEMSELKYNFRFTR